MRSRALVGPAPGCGYAARVMPPRPTPLLTAALLALLGASFVTAGAWAAEPAFIAAKSSELNWVPAPSVGPGAMLAVIEGDPKTGDPFTMRLKLPANTRMGMYADPGVRPTGGRER